MTNAPCPYLFCLDAHNRQGQPIDYPSFENRCQSQTERDTLLLTDQVTFCLSSSYQTCQRYQALRAREMLDSPSVGRQYQTEPTDKTFEPFGATQPLMQGPLGQRREPATDEVEAQATFADERGQNDSAMAASSTHQLHGLDEPFVNVVEDAVFHEQNYHSNVQTRPTQWYTRIGAGLLFLFVLIFGATAAVYTGWQLALDRLATARAGQINTLDSVPLQQASQPIYIVMTATSEPPAEPLAEQQPAIVPRTGIEGKPVELAQTPSANSFPAAVTATPVVIVPLPTESNPLPSTETGNGNEQVIAQPVDQQAIAVATNTPVNVQLPAVVASPTPVPVINVFLTVPPRRPTPTFDIPTSTPEPPAPTATATPQPILGTPVIIFGPDESSVPPGECTKVRWRVENVREVYYESQAAFGDGSKEECLKDERDTYALTVVFADGQTRIYTTTVDILWPTATPSITPSFTPEVLPTETWTPLPPTATPTPDVVYGTTLAVNGNNPTQCQPGTQCEIGILATNTGDSIDTLAIELVASGRWSAQLCNQIGTCSTSRLLIADVGPAHTVFVTLQVTIPAGTAGQRESYLLRSVSEGSQGTIISQVTELTIEISE